MKYLFTLIFLYTFLGYSQKEVISLPTDIWVKQSFNVVDVETGNFAIFLEGNDSVKAFLFDKDYNEIGRIIASDLPSKFKKFIGYKINNKTITIFMNTLNGRSYGTMEFDFEKGSNTVQEIDFKLKGEVYLEAISLNNKFYLFSIPKKSSQINIYEFNDDVNPILHEIIFDEDAFLDRRDRPISIQKFIYTIANGKKYVDTGKIENLVPNAIEVTSKNFKFYYSENKIAFTSDRYNEFTYIINIDLDTFKHSVKKIKKPDVEGSYLGLKTNSLLFANNLFQIVSNTKQLKFQVTNLSSDTIIKKFSVRKNEELFFKNTPIILEGGDFDKYRELEKTNQYLRKMSQANIGLSVYKRNGVYEITFGSTIEKEANSAILIGGMVGGFSGAIVVASFNLTTTSFNGYANTKSVRLTGLFDDNFNHLEGYLQRNPFDRIKIYYDKYKTIRAQTIFKHGDNFMYGFFKVNQNIYEIIKF